VERRGQLVFLFLILAQGAHSSEEYVTKLYAAFAPARFVSSLVSNDLALGFLVVNVALVTFGLWCWAVPVRSGWHAARGLFGSGRFSSFGHSAIALSRGGYFRGADNSAVAAPRCVDGASPGCWRLTLSYTKRRLPDRSACACTSRWTGPQR
jgi:hypothetical protein